MKKYEIVKNQAEVKENELVEGCTTNRDNQQEEVLKSFELEFGFL